MSKVLERGLTVFLPAPLLRIVLLAVPISVVCYFVSGLHDRPLPPEEMTAEAVAERLQPVARVVVTDAQASVASAAAAAPVKGQAVYEGLCFGCHAEGIAGAPKLGDRKAWAPRIAQGFNTLAKHAIEGYTGKTGMMPPKGGGSNEDVEVARAVAYMANKAGASFAEPVVLSK